MIAWHDDDELMTFHKSKFEDRYRSQLKAGLDKTFKNLEIFLGFIFLPVGFCRFLKKIYTYR